MPSTPELLTDTYAQWRESERILSTLEQRFEQADRPPGVVRDALENALMRTLLHGESVDVADVWVSVGRPELETGFRCTDSEMPELDAALADAVIGDVDRLRDVCDPSAVSPARV